MKKLLFLLFFYNSAQAQLYSSRTNLFDTSTQQYWVLNNKTFETFKDTIWISFLHQRVTFAAFGGINSGTPSTIAWLNTNGDLQNSPVSSIPLTSGQITTGLGFTPYNATNPTGFITATSTNALSNKSGNISQWTNDANYITRTGLSAGTGIGYNNSTGVISNSGVLTVNGSAGAITIDTTLIANFSVKVRSLHSVTAPLVYNSATGGFSITQANTSTNGYLSSTDWNTFNGKLSTIDTGNISNFYLKVRGLLSVTTTGTGAATYNNTTGIINVPTPTSISATDTLSASRAFNTAYTMSSTRYVRVAPSFGISCGLTLTGGTSGNVYLEKSANGTTNWITLDQIPASNTGTLTIGLATTQISGGSMSADIDPTFFWRLRTENITGTPVFTMNVGNKTTY